LSWYRQYEERFQELENFGQIGHTLESKYKLDTMFNPQGFINSVKQEIVRIYGHKNAVKHNFKIGSMFMITWVGEENPRKKRKDEEYQDAFKSVKITNLVLEGAIFSEKHQMEDSTDKMVYDNFCLKLSF
jgi:hypothetical protein